MRSPTQHGPYDVRVTEYFPLGQPEWRHLAPDFVAVKTVSRIITGVVVTLIAFIPTWIFADWRWALAVAVVLVALFAWRLVKMRTWCRDYRFALREHDLLVAEGLLSRTLVSIPYGRIQTVTVEDGMLDRRWGLANVTVHTASSQEGVVPGLPAEEAAALRDELIELSKTHAIAL